MISPRRETGQDLGEGTRAIQKPGDRDGFDREMGTGTAEDGRSQSPFPSPTGLSNGPGEGRTCAPEIDRCSPAPIERSGGLEGESTVIWLMTIVGPLAWPATALFLAMMFRDDIRRSLGRVGRLRYRDLEVTFRDDLRQAEALAKSLPIAPEPARPPASPIPLPAIVLEAGRDEDRVIAGRMIGDLGPPAPRPVEDREALVGLARESPREAVEAAWGVVGRARRPTGVVPGRPDGSRARVNPPSPIIFWSPGGCWSAPKPS